MTMNDIKAMVWFFPMLFIFHDFEEIIFMQPWINRNGSYICERFPKLSKRLLPHFDNITTSSFAFGVAEEFILISTITVISYMKNWYSLWIGLFIAFALHLVFHCFQALILRKYIPAVSTSIICLPLCLYIIKNTLLLLQFSTILLYSILGLIIMVINLALIHKAMDIFSKWLIQYEQQNKL